MPIKKISILPFLFVLFIAKIANAGFFPSTDTNIDWSQQLSFSGKMQKAAISAINTDSGIIIVGQNSSGEMVYAARNDNFWSNWEKLNGKMKGQAALDAEEKNVYLAVRGFDDGLWFNQKSGDNWTGWVAWGGTMAANPAVSKTSIGIEVIVKGTDGKLWAKRKNINGSFVEWRKIGDLRIKGEISVSDDGSGIIVVARDLDNKIYIVERNANGTWGEWIPLNSQGISDPFVLMNGNITYVAVIGFDNGLWFVKKENNTWGAWQNLNGNLKAVSPVIVQTEGRVGIFAMAPNNQVWYRLLRDGEWLDWNAVQGVAYYFNVASANNEFVIFETSSDDLVYRQSFYPTSALTSSDFSYRDYSIEDTATGGKKLLFYLSNNNYKIRLSYSVDPEQKVIAKNLGLAIANSNANMINHTNNTKNGAYVVVGSNQFSIGNSYIERKFKISQGIIATTEIYNKITGKRYSVNSDEFAIGFRAANDPAFIDIERMSLKENAQWSRGVGEPLIYSDLFSWTNNPFAIPKLVYNGGNQYLIQRLYYYSGITNQYSLDKSYAILGATENNAGLDGFRQYIVDLKNPENKFFFTYNSWWTAPFIYTENDIKNIAEQLNTNLISPYGAKIDSFTIDEGWANPQSIWKINKNKLSNGLQGINSILNAKGMALGLWISPGAIYATLSKDWAAQNGYSIGNFGESKIMCFGSQTGKKNYGDEFKNTLAEYLTKYDIANVKFDFFNYCRDNSADEAENFISVWNNLKTIKSNTKYELNIVFNPTMFPNGDILKDGFSGDYPSGLLPALNYKDAYLTTRDQSWLDDVARGLPGNLITTYGIIIQTNDDWRNDAMANLLRGVNYIPFYIDPKYMKSSDWADLAAMMKWARAHQDVLLENTNIIGGQPKNGDIYGISHFDSKTHEAYIYLRNPVINEKNFTLKLNDIAGLTVNDQYMVKTIYPYYYTDTNTYSLGGSVNFNLKGFETLVLHIKPQSAMANELTGGRYELANTSNKKITRVWGRSGTSNNLKIFNGQTYQTVKADFCGNSSIFKIASSTLDKNSNKISGSFNIQSSSNYTSQLVVSIHSSNKFNTENISNYLFNIDGTVVSPTIKVSDTTSNKETRKNSEQWRDGAEVDPLHYWKYFIINIPSGSHSLIFHVDNLPSGVVSSADILATESLISKDIEWSSSIINSDDELLFNNANKLTNTISVGQDVDWSQSCQTIPSCAPNSVSGCQVCNSSGTAWVDTNSKCLSTQTCQNGQCIIPCSNWNYVANIGGVLQYDPSIMSLDDKLIITGIGSDNALWANEFNPSTKQNEWYYLSGVLISATAMADAGSGKISVAAVGTDGAVWKRIYQSSKNWSNWESAGNISLTAGPDTAIINQITYKLVRKQDGSTEIGKCNTAACTPDCTAANAKQCSGNGVQACVMSGGCLKWSAAVACASGKTCNAGICQTSCTPKTCAILGSYQCGSWPDGCGKTISCGICASGKTCSNGKCVTNCITRSTKKCDNGKLYWYNSCNTKEGLAQDCGTDQPTSIYRCNGSWRQRETIKKICANNACASESAWVDDADCAASGKICSNGKCVTSSVSRNVQFVSQSIPARMVAGNTYSVHVTMKNTGTGAWTAADGYRLGAQNAQDNMIWGTNRAYLETTDSIAPGASKTFTFNVKAPSTLGTYNFQWQMVQEGVEWFGQKTTNVAVVVGKNSTCTPDCITVNAKQCSGNGIQTCTLTDGCLKWSAAVACATGQTCTNGVCQADAKNKTVSLTVSEKDLELMGCGMSSSTFRHQACRAKRWCVSKGYATGFQSEWEGNSAPATYAWWGVGHLSASQRTSGGTIQCVSDVNTFNVSEKDLESMGCGMSSSTFQHQACRAKRWCVSKGYATGFQSEWGISSGTIQCVSGATGFEVSYGDLDATGCATDLDTFQRHTCRASRWCVSKGYATGFQSEWGVASGGVFCIGKK